MKKFTAFIPNEGGLQAMLELLRFTGAIAGYALYPDGLGIDFPQPHGTRAGLWEGYCKEHGLSVGEHSAPPVEEPKTVPDGNQVAAAEAPEPPKKRPVRRAAK